MGIASFNRALNGTLRDDEDFRPKVGRAGKSGNGAAGTKAARATLSGRLEKRLGRARLFGGRASNAAAPSIDGYAADPRQRAIVKVHYFNHAGGGGAAMRAHARYIERDGAGREADVPELGPAQEQAPDQAHAAYLSRNERTGFYDWQHDGVDGAARMANWSRADTRHFRIILSPENGQAIGDLPGYTREVMERAEAALGRKLEWVAVDHWDTDNPHSHIVLRGRGLDGRHLGLPREFVKHRFREIARDTASERLGPRGPEEARLALDREVRAQRLTRLDHVIANGLDKNGAVRISELGAGLPDSATAQRVKARAVELRRLGLADEVKRGVLHFSPDWRERLSTMELHIDIRKRVVRERTIDHGQKAFERAANDLERETGKPFQSLSGRNQTWRVRDVVDLPQGQQLALERHNAVALMPKPRNLDIQPGQSITVQMERGAAKITRAFGLER